MVGSVRWILVAIGLAVALLGCGGTGEEAPRGADPTKELLSGDYAWSSLAGFAAGASAAASAGFGSAEADGRELVVRTALENRNGSRGPLGTSDPLPFVIQAGGVLEFFAAQGATEPLYQGGLRSDGHLGVLATLLPASSPGIALLLKRGGAAGASVLQGDYHAVGWIHDQPAGGGSTTFVGTLRFDGQGAGSAAGEKNDDGALSGVLLDVLYSVGTGGALTVELTEGSDTVPVEGQVLDGSRLAVAAGGTVDDTPPMLWCFLEQATYADAGLFAGEYHLVTFLQNPLLYVCSYGTLVCDGLGNWQAIRRANQGGLVSDLAVESGTFAVGSDGTMRLDYENLFVLKGGITASGDCAVLGGPETKQASPQLWILIRK